MRVRRTKYKIEDAKWCKKEEQTVVEWFPKKNRLGDVSRSARSTRFRYHRQNCITTLARSRRGDVRNSRDLDRSVGEQIVFVAVGSVIHARENQATLRVDSRLNEQ